MLAWLTDAEQIPNDRSRGGTYVDDDVPWKFCAHTTEVVPSSLTAAKTMAGRHEFPPHLWAWPERDWVAQTVPLDRSAFALKHPAGTPETNKMRVIQAEIIGRAADSPLHPDDWWLWIGRRVLRPIIEAGYPINLDRVARTIGPEGYGLRGAVRMSRAAFRDFDGILCHANVPDNEHWDIGAGRLDLIAQGARRIPTPAPTPTPADPLLLSEGPMILILRTGPDGGPFEHTLVDTSSGFEMPLGSQAQAEDISNKHPDTHLIWVGPETVAAAKDAAARLRAGTG